MNELLERLASCTLEELPAIKAEMEAEYTAQKVLYDASVAVQVQASETIATHSRKAAEHKAIMSSLSPVKAVGARYIELLNS